MGITHHRITCHTLRHTFATHLTRENKVSIVVAQRLLGHSRLTETARYQHPEDDEMLCAVERLAETQKLTVQNVELY